MNLQDAFKFHGLPVEDFILISNKISFVDPRDSESFVTAHVDDLKNFEDFRVCDGCLLAERPMREFGRGYCEEEDCEAEEYFSS